MKPDLNYVDRCLATARGGLAIRTRLVGCFTENGIKTRVMWSPELFTIQREWEAEGRFLFQKRASKIPLDRKSLFVSEIFRILEFGRSEGRSTTVGTMEIVFAVEDLSIQLSRRVSIVEENDDPRPDMLDQLFREYMHDAEYLDRNHSLL